MSLGLLETGFQGTLKTLQSHPPGGNENGGGEALGDTAVTFRIEDIMGSSQILVQAARVLSAQSQSKALPGLCSREEEGHKWHCRDSCVLHEPCWLLSSGPKSDQTGSPGGRS
jgi:hypothetical protein